MLSVLLKQHKKFWIICLITLLNIAGLLCKCPKLCVNCVNCVNRIYICCVWFAEHIGSELWHHWTVALWNECLHKFNVCFCSEDSTNAMQWMWLAMIMMKEWCRIHPADAPFNCTFQCMVWVFIPSKTDSFLILKIVYAIDVQRKTKLNLQNMKSYMSVDSDRSMASAAASGGTTSGDRSDSILSLDGKPVRESKCLLCFVIVLVQISSWF